MSDASATTVGMHGFPSGNARFATFFTLQKRENTTRFHVFPTSEQRVFTSLQRYSTSYHRFTTSGVFYNRDAPQSAALDADRVAIYPCARLPVKTNSSMEA